MSDTTPGHGGALCSNLEWHQSSIWEIAFTSRAINQHATAKWALLLKAGYPAYNAVPVIPIFACPACGNKLMPDSKPLSKCPSGHTPIQRPSLDNRERDVIYCEVEREGYHIYLCAGKNENVVDTWERLVNGPDNY